MADANNTLRPHEEWERERQIVERMRERLHAWTPADGEFETHCAFLRDAADVLSIYWRERINAEIDVALAKHVLGEDRRSYSFWERIWRFPANPDHQSLSDWLFTATRGLNAESLPRIEEEISAHYREEFERAMQSGATPAGAHREAIRSLGNAKQARKEFRRVHLTHAESKLLEDADALSSHKIKMHFPLLNALLTLSVLLYLIMAIPDSLQTRQAVFWSAGALWFASGLFAGFFQHFIRRTERGTWSRTVAFAFAGATGPNSYFCYPTAALYMTFIGHSNESGAALLVMAYGVVIVAAILIFVIPLRVGHSHWRATKKQQALRR